jgi:hypothetical protein
VKKNSVAIRLIVWVFVAAIAVYAAFYALSSLMKTETKAMATQYSVRDTIDINGIVARDEETLLTYYDSVYILTEDGKRVSKGGAVANIYASGEGLSEAVQLTELETKLSRLSQLSRSGGSSQGLDSEIKSAVFRLKSAAHRRRLTELGSLTIDLDTLLLTASNGLEEAERRLSETRSEYLSLLGHSDSVLSVISAPYSGLFSRAVDGFEDLAPAQLYEMKPSELEELMAEKREKNSLAFGKLVYGTKWYYAAPVSSEDCKKFSIGDSVSMIFGRYYSERIEMTVENISEPEGGKKVMLFSCDKSLSDVLAMRLQSAEIILSEDSGIRIPRVSARVDEQGETYVFVQTGIRLEKKKIEILYDIGDYYVVASDELRPGDTVITGGKNLFEGKVIN